jgi:hypothetical protein
MSRTHSWPQATESRMLYPLLRTCPVCGGAAPVAYRNERTVTTLSGLMHLTLQIRRCQNPRCSRFHKAYRPEEEGALDERRPTTGSAMRS